MLTLRFTFLRIRTKQLCWIHFQIRKARKDRIKPNNLKRKVSLWNSFDGINRFYSTSSIFLQITQNQVFLIFLLRNMKLRKSSEQLKNLGNYIFSWSGEKWKKQIWSQQKLLIAEYHRLKNLFFKNLSRRFKGVDSFSV